jgi:SurA N-terminal domain
MTITRLSLLPALLVALLVAGCGGGDATSSDDVPSDAVAVVDGREIPRTQFDTLIEQAKRSYKSQKREFPKAGSEEYQTLRNQAVAALVQKVELEQAAEEMGIKVTDEDIDKRLDKIVKQY